MPTRGRGTGEDEAGQELKDKYYFNLRRHDYEVPSPKNAPNVLGRLKARVDYREQIGAPEFILDTLRTGYKLPLIDTPESRSFRNNESALRNQEFVSEAIDDLLQSGRIIKLRTLPYVVNPLSVSENGKKRLILDLDALTSISRRGT